MVLDVAAEIVKLPVHVRNPVVLEDDRRLGLVSREVEHAKLGHGCTGGETEREQAKRDFRDRQPLGLPGE